MKDVIRVGFCILLLTATAGLLGIGIYFMVKGWPEERLFNGTTLKGLGCVSLAGFCFQIAKNLLGRGSSQPGSTAQIGQDYEKACAARLRKTGYRNVRLTPVTGDFGADILANDSHGRLVCFQCKCYSGNVGESAVQEVISAVQYYGADYGVVLTNAGFTAKAQELASRAGVTLVPGYKADLDWIDRIEGYDAFLSD